MMFEVLIYIESNNDNNNNLKNNNLKPKSVCIFASCLSQRDSSLGKNSPYVDGIISIGPCKDALENPWFTKKIISHNVIGICIANELHNQFSGPYLYKKTSMGYLSIGIDYKEDFHQSNSFWAKLYAKHRCLL